MNNASDISIALCTYNAEKYLNILLDSLLHQTLPAVEIVVFDDASTDTTKLILQEFQTLHPTIFKLHFNETNVGLDYSRNNKNSRYCSSLQ